MVCFLVVLFFALTGITLNHPNWTLGTSPTHTVQKGTFPTSWKSGNTVDWLRVSEHLRNTYGIKGAVGDYRNDDQQGSISFKGPGYEANAAIDMKKGSYELTVDSQGLIAVLNDLHKGRDTRSSWKWVIDVAGGFLALVSLSGLLLQFFLRKRRTRAYVTAVTGGLVLAVMTWLAVR